MIDVKELRIGNWIIDAGCGKTQIRGEMMDEYLWRGENAFPIPLTPEILEACGFEKVNHIHRYSFFTSKVKKYKGLPIIDVYEGRTEVMGYPVKHCASLHELMNLFFSLTGKELTYSPNTTVK